MKLGSGSVVLVELDPTAGHEQQGVRPCVVVSDPDVISDQRFPLGRIRRVFSAALSAQSMSPPKAAICAC